MSNVSMTEISMVKWLLNMPYEIVFEVLYSLPKGKMLEITKLSSKFKDIARDTRIWKNVHIEYKPDKYRPHEIFDFEELYSGPCPVKVINLSEAKVNPPVPSRTGPVTKVTTLCLASIEANHTTIEAILAKCQCRELIFPLITRDEFSESLNFRIAPETFSKQTALEVLSLEGDDLISSSISKLVGRWLRQVLSYCKNLKTFKLNFYLTKSGRMCFLKNLPTSLEKLFIEDTEPDDSVFELLAKNHPNLKELELSPETVEYPSLLKFKFSEVLHFTIKLCTLTLDLTYLCEYLIKFPALKSIYMWLHFDADFHQKRNLEELRTKLEAHNISFSFRTVKRILGPAPEGMNFADSNHWIVSKADIQDINFFSISYRIIADFTPENLRAHYIFTLSHPLVSVYWNTAVQFGLHITKFISI